jgi:Na+-transporting NADH:ubiquinone oxidoreductase subunit F
MMAFFKKLHKWVGLLIGIQMLLWLLSGLMISLLDPLKVSGKLWTNSAKTHQQELQTGVLLEPWELPPALLSGASSIKLEVIRAVPVYRIQQGENESLIDATDGSLIITGKTDAERIARQDYTGNGELVSLEQGMAPDMETRTNSGEYWRVNFSDAIHTSIYISVASGEVFERRNSYWRVRDFFWMLHIMDYSGRENFNNVLIIMVVLIAVWLGISGMILIFGSFSRHDFYFLNILRKTNQVTITLIDPASESPRHVSLRQGSNLFLSLATHGINLPSICGGGGECGRCRVKIESDEMPTPTDIEQGLIPGPLREQGFRLACQLEVTNKLTLQLSPGALAGPNPSA